MGPGQNPAEWVVPFILRQDITIYVFFESEEQMRAHKEAEMINDLWSGLVKNYPKIIAQAKITNEQLLSEVQFNHRLKFVIDISQPHNEIAQSDFVIAMMPQSGGLTFPRRMKPGSSGWVVMPATEAFNLLRGLDRTFEYQIIPSGPVSLLGAPIGRSCAVVFRGIAGRTAGMPMLIYRR